MVQTKTTTPIIGLEVHIELETTTKMFCSCKAEHFGAEPNTQTCPVCLGLPGSLPFPNKKAIEWTILVGLALNCQINEFTHFDRKNYFYPDLPKGYQISQYAAPLAKEGSWKLEAGSWIRIRRVHLEEDTGKLVHFARETLIDFNRAGVPLMEIVTEPDINSAAEAKIFLQKIQQLVRYLGVAEAEMERGQMRCEPNVNLKITKRGKTYFTPITEIKNVNSFRFVERAINYEIKRQFEEFQKTRIEMAPGNKTTRGWDEEKQITVPHREKEEAQDYRYFPEPDIPPIKILRYWDIKKLRERLPELPEQKAERFMREYQLSAPDARLLGETCRKADYFEEAVKEGKNYELTPKQIANWVINKRVDINRVSPSQLGEMILKKTQVTQISKEELKKVIEKILRVNQKAVADYKKGKTQALEFLVGQVVRQTKGKAGPNQVRQLLQGRLRLEKSG